ncbi:polymorphic toxin-type HINT domain-containing protein [Actinocrispum wychmicini]|uniref:Intein/intein/RHS repeat-associated protein n=1 Tax=Actinocrispum wychmicini TaxID=1213861 RepID=A0A4R2JBP7_9PSEU|nr:polymorphic toxin-type HINT domain-containing protein [Actinocrispum wychmicini]TCO55807.1 intein/intein/RHS repeat-associated protein [Actinocrispum wychmicini]
MRSRVKLRGVSTWLVTMLVATLVPALAPLPASAADGPPSVPLPPTASVSLAQQAAQPRPKDQAALSERTGDQGHTGAKDGGGVATATPLSPSAGWAVSAQTGDFTWSYPLSVPPAPGGLRPNLALSYQSSAVDGRTSVTNNQSSWVGDGWDLVPGFVERTYDSCLDEGVQTGDLCWKSDNATAVYGGSGGQLICCDGDNRWRAKNDDGSRIERLRTGHANGDDGDNDGEYWVITTVDGTQYWFGSEVDSRSTWTVPVFGNNANEPCHVPGNFADSHCMQAWRWNLDKVVDRNGNMIRYYYNPETNSYGMNLKDTAVSYTRGGTLDHIDYGLHETKASTPSARVVFGTAERCVPGSNCTHDMPDNYPDTPLEDKCVAATCPDKHSPTFFSTKRLTTITTQVRDGADFRPVDRWDLTQTFPDAGSGEKPALWLKEITHTGLVGGSASTPAIRFEGTAMPNRVEMRDGVSPLYRYRVTGVVSETGGWLSVNYGSECRAGGPMPDRPETNKLRCFPVRWSPPKQAERTDYFHKYVVDQTVTSDWMSSSAQSVTGYEYLDGAAWHWNTSEFGKEENKTWNDFRGFGRVRIRSGSDGDPSGPVTMSENRYYQGMDGDRFPAPDDGGRPPSGARSVTVTDSQGKARADSDWLHGLSFESATFNGVGGAVVTKTITEPSWQGPTATRDVYKAYIVRPGTTRTYTTLESGGPRVTMSETSYNNRGLPEQVNDLGDESTADDDRCVNVTYAPVVDKWLLGLTARTETVSIRCGQTPTFPGNALSDTKNTFDGNGNLVKVEEAKERPAGGPVYVTTSTATYDDHGRAKTATDALNRTTKMAYVPEAGGPLTQTVLTTPGTDAVPQGLVTTTTVDPAWGKPTLITDPNQRRTQIEYDPLGRTARVWLPNRPKSDNPKPSAEYSYLIRNDALTAVTTTLIGPNGNQISSNALFDGWLRPRQAQGPAMGGGRLITDTVYDSQGRAWKSTQPYFNNAPIDTTLWNASDADIPGHTRTKYDGAGRAIASTYYAGATEKWSTKTSYGGDRVHVTPPAGGVATTTINDARGQTVELRRYTTPEPSASFDTTRYDHTPAGELASVTDPAGTTWRYTYDLRGRQIKAEDPDTGTSTTTYDDAGQVVTATDMSGKTLAYDYDALGRKKHLYADRVNDANKLAEWTYDTANKGKGQPATATRWVDGQAYTTAVADYSALYQPNQTSVTIPTAQGRLAGTYTTYNSYTPDGGSVAGVDYPAGGKLPRETVTYGYHDLGPVKSSSGGYDGNTFRYVNDTEYTRYGEAQRLHLGVAPRRAWLSFYYNTNTRRLNRSIVDAEIPSPMVTDTHYTQDPAGNITAVADTPLDQSSTVDVQCFRYDHLRRLTEAWSPGVDSWTEKDGCKADPAVAGLRGPAKFWNSYTFDGAGNRRTETRHTSAGDTTSTYTYDVPGHAHALGTVSTGNTRDSYAYNAVGQTTQRALTGAPTQKLDWDSERHLVKVTDGAKETSFVYDADGNRLIRRDPDGITLYLGAQEVRWNPNGGEPAATRYYTHGGQVVAMRVEDGPLTWLAGDHQATAQIAIDSQTNAVTRRRQLPFGAPRGDQVAWPSQRGFVGGTQDPSTGLTHLGAREYDPGTGRFISVDPLVNFGDPQQLTGYGYANESPVTASDPTGLISNMCVDRCGGDVRPSSPANDDGIQVTEITPAIVIYEDTSTGKRYVNSVAIGDNAPPTYELKHMLIQQQKGKTRLEWEGLYDEGDTLRAIEEGCGSFGGKACSGQFLQHLVSGQWADPIWGQDGGVGARLSTTGRVGVNGAYGKGPTKGKLLGIIRAGHGGRSAEPMTACSFTGDTQVLMADGSTKTIAEIKEGDQVLAADPDTGERAARTVTATIVHDDTVVDLVTDDGATVTTTRNHPFWNDTDHRWEPADQLDPGDDLLTSAGKHIRVAGLRPGSDHRALAYNLTVADMHTYHVRVGNATVLVHNMCAAKKPRSTTFTEGKVPDHVENVVRYREENGGAPPGLGGTKPYDNDGRGGTMFLPFHDSAGNPIKYKEGFVLPRSAAANGGTAERIVWGNDGSYYYTSDHYINFMIVRPGGVVGNPRRPRRGVCVGRRDLRRRRRVLGMREILGRVARPGRRRDRSVLG